MPVTTVIALDAQSPRVSWQVTVDNRARDHRLRMTFPAGVESIAEVRAETAFGVVRRPARRDVPPQVRVEMPMSYGPTSGFIEAGDGKAGAIVYGDGLAEYEAVPDENGRTSRLALTLLRAVGYLSREDLVTRPSGHAGPGLATPGAQCIGVYEFRAAFEPRGDSPSGNALFARAASFVAPPHVVPAIGSEATLPTSGQFLTIEQQGGGSVLSALHRTADGTGIVVRFFNADDQPASLRLRPHRPVAGATMVDLLERPAGQLDVQNGAVQLEVGSFRIATVRLT